MCATSLGALRTVSCEGVRESEPARQRAKERGAAVPVRSGQPHTRAHRERALGVCLGKSVRPRSVPRRAERGMGWVVFGRGKNGVMNVMRWAGGRVSGRRASEAENTQHVDDRRRSRARVSPASQSAVFRFARGCRPRYTSMSVGRVLRYHRAHAEFSLHFSKAGRSSTPSAECIPPRMSYIRLARRRAPLLKLHCAREDRE